MMFILGTIFGLLLAVIQILLIKKYQTPIERTITRVENMTKEKGEVYVDDDAKIELERFLEELPTE
jgi:ABC-type lipoprotein release transport system permease subunit